MRRGNKLVRSFESRLNSNLDKMVEGHLASRLKGVDKINIGCGDRFVEGWLNIGLFPEAHIPYGSVVRKDNGALVLNFDMNRRLPISKNTVRYVYASHFIEHLSFENGRVFLEGCYKMMKKGGIIRLAFPDMELWIRKYSENDREFFDKYRSIFLRDKPVSTKGEVFMSQVHGFGHKWNYDFEAMKNTLEKVGFSSIMRKVPFDSLIPEIRSLEPAEEGRVLETAYVEGQKE